MNWWNRGGGLLKRLKVNPELKNILSKKPDIFTFGESGLSKKSGLFLKDYFFFFIAPILKKQITIAEV